MVNQLGGTVMKRIIIKAATATEKVYQNKRNPNKFVEVKKGADGHSYVRQYMKWDTDNGEVKNYNASKSNRGRYYRATQKTINQILEDYVEVSASVNTSDDVHYSQMSFDFGYDVDYDESAVREAAETALRYYDTLGTDFESVDYSQYEEYNNMSTSQCNTDFSYSGDYNSDAIEDRLFSEMNKLGYEVLGVDFFDMDHAYKKSV